MKVQGFLVAYYSSMYKLFTIFKYYLFIFSIITLLILFQHLLTKNKSGAHKIQGIGANFIPKNYLSEYVDEIIDITDEEAYEKAIACAKNYGLFVGISSGAALAAINHLSNKYKNIVVILPDGGERYLSVWDLEK